MMDITVDWHQWFTNILIKRLDTSTHTGTRTGTELSEIQELANELNKPTTRKQLGC